MTETYQARGGGIGFLGMLTILFIALKLTGVIAWSWWWVLAPLWIPWAIMGIVALSFLAAVSFTKFRAVRRREKVRAAARERRYR